MNLKSRWLCTALLPLASAVWAEDAANVTQQEAPTINKAAVERIVQMGDYLRGLRSFSVDSDVTRDVVLDSGQKIKTLGTSQLKVNGRSKLYSKLDTDRITREYFYNGTELTQYSPALKYYTTVKASDNVYDMLHEVEKYYGISIPMEDLFTFGKDQDQLDSITSALYVGPSKVGGKVCDHYAFRQNASDWQLWISRDAGQPLPCKLVITSTEESSQPEYSAVYHWSLKPALKDSVFSFKQHKGDVAIPIAKQAQ